MRTTVIDPDRRARDWSPRWSYKNVLSERGRLENKWAKALEESDPHRAMDRLREVRKKLESNLQAFGDLWLPFLRDFLHADRLPLVAETDLRQLIEMGELADSPNHQVGAGPFWFRVIEACDDLQKRGLGIQILAKICRGSHISREDKVRAARELARRDAVEEEHFEIYIHHFSLVPSPLDEKDVLDLLRNCCAKDAGQLLSFQRKLVAKPLTFKAVWPPLFEHFVKAVQRRRIRQT